MYYYYMDWCQDLTLCVVNVYRHFVACSKTLKVLGAYIRWLPSIFGIAAYMAHPAYRHVLMLLPDTPDVPQPHIAEP